jgi:hypothetical protein
MKGFFNRSLSSTPGGESNDATLPNESNGSAAGSNAPRAVTSRGQSDATWAYLSHQETIASLPSAPNTFEGNESIDQKARTLASTADGKTPPIWAIKEAFQAHTEKYVSAVKAYQETKPKGWLQDLMPAPGTAEASPYVADIAKELMGKGQTEEDAKWNAESIYVNIFEESFLRSNFAALKKQSESQCRQ